jgi:biopolymer transport protein ExbB
MRFLVCSLIALALTAPVAASGQQQPAAEPKASSLQQLLENTRELSRREEQENLRREAEFKAAQADQRRLLEEALRAEAVQQARAEELEREFEANENVLPQLEETLRNRLGTLGEVFGVVRQVAGDARSRFQTSVISAQIPGRTDFLSDLAESSELPSIADLRRLWLGLQEEMTEQGRVTAFDARVVSSEGGESTQRVVRVGPFNVISGGNYLAYEAGDPDNPGKLVELARQPAGRYLGTVSTFERARDGLNRFSLDPTSGTLLSMLIQAPDMQERVQQGGIVGYVIIVLGAIGLVLALYRLGVLAVAGRRIHAQAADPSPDRGNALGRVYAVYQANQRKDVETLELKLDEQILKETGQLQRGTTLVKVLSVIAPLLGLLGTVTGMILTFQQITLFGTGDPKIMAGGISQALVTTVLGLVMAIPLTLLHSMIADRSKSLVQILEEHSVGLVAEQSESLSSEAN